MSNALAIAAATRTLRSLLGPVTANVTSLPLDKARDNGAGEQLNVFLYQSVLAAAWRNGDPRQGDSALPPLPICLHYLLTAYAEDEAGAHAVLGRAMAMLHDHPVLDAQEIEDANVTDLPDSDLHLQPERIRITPLGLSTDDLFKLWSGFQTAYRVSAAYELSVILIDSQRPARTPLPVLRQGAEDRGPYAIPAPGPSLAAALPPSGMPVASLGDTVRLRGSALDTPSTRVRFSSLRLAAPIELPPGDGSSGERSVTLPAPDSTLPSGSPANSEWAPGLYTVALVTTQSDSPSWVSNEVVFGLGARITVAPLAVTAGNVELTIMCSPRLRPGQRVLVSVGERQAQPTSVVTPPDETQPTTVNLHLDDVTAGTYLVRLRVDGIESNPVVLTGSPQQPMFDPDQQVVVT